MNVVLFSEGKKKDPINKEEDDDVGRERNFLTMAFIAVDKEPWQFENYNFSVLSI